MSGTNVINVTLVNLVITKRHAGKTLHIPIQHFRGATRSESRMLAEAVDGVTKLRLTVCGRVRTVPFRRTAISIDVPPLTPLEVEASSSASASASSSASALDTSPERASYSLTQMVLHAREVRAAISSGATLTSRVSCALAARVVEYAKSQDPPLPCAENIVSAAASAAGNVLDCVHPVALQLLKAILD